MDRTRSTPILLRGFGLCAAPPTTSPSSLMPARTSSSALDKYSPTALEDLSSKIFPPEFLYAVAWLALDERLRGIEGKFCNDSSRAFSKTRQIERKKKRVWKKMGLQISRVVEQD